MQTLVSKDEEIKSSAVYIGSLILKKVQKAENGKVSIFDIAESLKGYKIYNYRQIVFSLMFLYSCGIVDFKAPYIYKI
jgi:hypothetical protein